MNVIDVEPKPLTEDALLEDSRRIQQENRSSRHGYADMENNRNVRGETISMYLIQQFPDRSEQIYDYIG